MAFEARDVHEILHAFERAGIPVWIEGGWGIDALLGVQHREHGDLDIVIDAPRAEDARSIMVAAGYEVIFEDLPGYVSFTDGRGRFVDISISTADRYGDRWNVNRRIGRGEPDYPFDCFTYGWIGGQKVSCLGPETQIAHHIGYEIEEVDRFDVGLLRDRFGVAVPEGLR